MKNTLFRRITIFFVLPALIMLLAASFSGRALAATDGPDIEGTSAIVYCVTTDEVLWQKNADKKMNLASITKLMTCLIAIEEMGLDKEVTVAAEAVQATWEGQSEPVGITAKNLRWRKWRMRLCLYRQMMRLHHWQ